MSRLPFTYIIIIIIIIITINWKWVYTGWQCAKIEYSTIQYNTVQYNTIQYNTHHTTLKTTLNTQNYKKTKTTRYTQLRLRKE
jgi:predicted negative regulator of RcsB-dependent stress response